jgi:pimeloyl-ACP methyl ester carboxylesterase
MYEHASKLKMPIMIAQGTADESVDYKVAQDVVELFPNARLELIQGADHGLKVDGDFSEGIKIMKDFFLE